MRRRQAWMLGVLVPTICATALSGAVIGGAGPSAAGLSGAAVDGETLTRPAPAATMVRRAELSPPLPDDAPRPDPTELNRLLAAQATAASLGPRVSYAVIDAATGDPLASREPTAARVPASTAKLLTAAAALQALGPATRLPTKVVDGATADEIVLVGGGDVLLAAGRGHPGAVNGRAGLVDLAEATAAALRREGRTTVTVRLDDSLFSGPSVAPGWSRSDVANGYVAPVMSLSVNAGRVRPGAYAQRHRDPAGWAARQFVTALRRAGIRVPAASAARARAGRNAAELARVESAPISDLVEYILTTSDNTAAEALARLVAERTDRPATFRDAGVAVLDQVALLGVRVEGARLTDGSGLGTGSRLSAQLLAELLGRAAAPGQTRLRPLLSGLPVASASGTLAARFDRPADRAGAGLVRAKTGTLTGVNALAGTVVDADGRLLAFAVLADRTRPGHAARDALDALIASMARCGCRTGQRP